MPGPFDYEAGIGRYSSVAKFDALNGIDVGTQLLAALGGLPARIVFLNDAAAFGIGEWVAGAARVRDTRHCDKLVAITLGTGVGSAFIDAGRPVTHGPRVPPHGYVYLLRINGRPLEDVMSTRAIVAAYLRSSGTVEASCRGRRPACRAACSGWRPASDRRVRRRGTWARRGARALAGQLRRRHACRRWWNCPVVVARGTAAALGHRAGSARVKSDHNRALARSGGGDRGRCRLACVRKVARSTTGTCQILPFEATLSGAGGARHAGAGNGVVVPDPPRPLVAVRGLDDPPAVVHADEWSIRPPPAAVSVGDDSYRSASPSPQHPPGTHEERRPRFFLASEAGDAPHTATPRGATERAAPPRMVKPGLAGHPIYSDVRGAARPRDVEVGKPAAQASPRHPYRRRLGYAHGTAAARRNSPELLDHLPQVAVRG